MGLIKFRTEDDNAGAAFQQSYARGAKLLKEAGIPDPDPQGPRVSGGPNEGQPIHAAPTAGAPIVPGEGTSPGEPSLGLLHPVQFHVHQAAPPQSSAQRIKGLAQTAKGQSATDLALNARELLFSGSNSPQHQLRGLTNTRGATSA